MKAFRTGLLLAVASCAAWWAPAHATPFLFSDSVTISVGPNAGVHVIGEADPAEGHSFATGLVVPLPGFRNPFDAIALTEPGSANDLSDIAWVNGSNQVFVASDRNGVFFSDVPLGLMSFVVSIPETGAPQDISAFFAMQPGTLVVQSDIETPLPATLPLFASGIAGLGLFGSWRRRRGSAIPA